MEIRTLRDFLYSLVGWKVQLPRPREELEIRSGMINGNEYEFYNDRVTQKTGSEGGIWLFLADSHGHTPILKRLCEKGIQVCEERHKKLTGIVHLGDFAQIIRKNSKYNKDKSDVDEMIEGMEAIAEFGLPFPFIPGNQDLKDSYRTAVINIMERFGNALDMSDVSGRSIFEGRGYNFIFNHWGDDFTYRTEIGYRGNKEIDLIGVNARKITNGNLKILCTHVPLKGRGKLGIDLALRKAVETGESAINWNMESNGIHSCAAAHLSENGGRAFDKDFNRVFPGSFVESANVSVGASSPWQYLKEDLDETDEHWGGKCYEGMANLIEISQGLISFQPIYLNECELDEDYNVKKVLHPHPKEKRVGGVILPR